jgi:hypothetical protein
MWGILLFCHGVIPYYGSRGLALAIDLLRKEPIFENGIEDFDEMAEVARLAEVGIHAKPVSFGNVFIEARAAEHDGAEAGELRLVAQPMKDLKAGHPRHFEVEDEKLRERKLSAINEFAFALEILDDFHPVSDLVNLNGLLVPAQCELEQPAIIGIVFSEENCKLIIHGPNQRIPKELLVSQ